MIRLIIRNCIKIVFISGLNFSGVLHSAAYASNDAKINKSDQNEHAAAEPELTIGTATQEVDGTIVLNLRSVEPTGEIVEAQVRYPSTDKNYEAVSHHIGVIPYGESVFVKPFPK